MRSIKMNRGTVDVVSTAAEWELFSASMDCTEANAALNAAVDLCAKAIQREAREHDVGKHFLARLRAEIMDPVQSAYSKFGASDSEPDYHVCETLRRLACAANGYEVKFSRWD